MPKVFISIIAVLIGLELSAQDTTIRFSAPQKMSEDINSDGEESFPILSRDGTRLYFARTYHKDNVGGMYAGQDILYSELENGMFGTPKPLEELNDQNSNVVVGVSADNQRLYLLNQYTEGSARPRPGVSVSRYDSVENRWHSPQPVFIPNLQVKSAFYSVFVSPNEDFILFSLPTTTSDSAHNDIFVSLSDDGGETWQEPISVGPDINTEQDEISPYYDRERQLLFYSSNRSEEGSRYDVKYAKRMGDSWSSWSEPQTASVNSTKFDAYFFTATDGTAYFSSNRNDSLANLYISDISASVPDTTEQEIAEEKQDSIVVDTSREHELIIESGGAETRDRELSSMTREELLNESTIIRFVYFKFDKYDITPKYIEVLDDVAEILDANPDVYVKINGHTDAVGTDAYNQVLSENRAQSTEDWLVMNGIDPSRIKTEGFGEREPYTTNATPDGRAMNRRVEIFFRVMDQD